MEVCQRTNNVKHEYVNLHQREFYLSRPDTKSVKSSKEIALFCLVTMSNAKFLIKTP